MTLPDKAWFWVSEVAALFTLFGDERTVRRYCEQGYFPGAVKLPSGHWRIPKAALEKYSDKSDKSDNTLP